MDTINSKVGSVLKYGIVVIFFTMSIEIIMRYVFNAPTVWAPELTQMVFGVYFVLSGGYILLGGGHVNVDILFSTLTDKTRAKLDIFTSFLFFIFTGVLIYFGASLASESIEMWESSMTARDPPIWEIKLMIPVGAVLLLLQGIAKLFRDILFLIEGTEFAKEETL